MLNIKIFEIYNEIRYRPQVKTDIRKVRIPCESEQPLSIYCWELNMKFILLLQWWPNIQMIPMVGNFHTFHTFFKAHWPVFQKDNCNSWKAHRLVKSLKLRMTIWWMGICIELDLVLPCVSSSNDNFVIVLEILMCPPVSQWDITSSRSSPT